MPFKAGFNISFGFQLDGLGATSIVSIYDSSWKEAVDKLDVCSSATLGLQALLAGILRGDGSFKGYIDTLFLPWGAPIPFLVSGATGMLLAGFGTFSPFSVPCLITDVTSAGAVNGVMNWTVNCGLNILAGTRVYTRAS